MNLANIRNALLLEGRLILKSRATVLLAAILLFVIVWAGFISPYNQALRSEERFELRRGEMERIIEELGVVVYHEILSDFVSGPFRALHPAAGPNNIRALLATLLPMAMAILGANIVGSEFVKRTVKVRAAHYGWSNTVFTKGLAIILVTVLVAIVASFIGLLGGYITWHMLLRASEIAKELPHPNILICHWQQILVLILGSSVYGMLGAFAANVTRSPLAGAVVALGTPFLERLLLLEVWWLPRNATASLMGEVFVYFDGGLLHPPSAATAADPAWLYWIILAGWSILFFFLMWWFSRRQAIG